MEIRKLAAVLLLSLFSAGAWSQSFNVGSYYTVQPDYRRCASPFCGGWWLTAVNRYPAAAGENVLDGSVVPIIPNPIYVAEIDYRALGLTDRQIQEFERRIHEGKGFIRGVLRPYSYPGSDRYGLRELAATGTWVAANDNPPQGPYLNVRSSGIVCITTPCPYYDAQLLNTGYRTPVHELNLERARLTDEQTELAREEVNGRGLVMTGVRFESKGQTGTGLGIAATKVFFTFPGPSKAE